MYRLFASVSLCLSLLVVGCASTSEPSEAPAPAHAADCDCCSGAAASAPSEECEGCASEASAGECEDCASESSKTASAGPATKPVAAAKGASVYDVACGCSLPDVGHCGEYAKVGDSFVQIEGDLGLGSMPFCGKTGLKAKIQGAVEGGKLKATSLEMVE